MLYFFSLSETPGTYIWSSNIIFGYLIIFFSVTSNNLVYITVLVLIVKTSLLAYPWGCLFLVSVGPLCSCSADFIIRFIAAENTITYNIEPVLMLLSILRSFFSLEVHNKYHENCFIRVSHLLLHYVRYFIPSWDSYINLGGLVWPLL